MIDNTNSQSNEERHLAIQAEINAKKDAHRDSVSPEEAARIAIIEEVSKRLDDAKIPFLLHADSTPFGESPEKSTWWQFNKLGYEKDWDTMVENKGPRMRSMVKRVLCHISGYVAGSIVCFNHDLKPMGAAQDGEWYPVPKPDSNESN